MKRLALVLLGIVLLVAAGLWVFIATFDADRYRPLLVETLEDALDAPVTLEHVSLGLRQGIALELQGLAIYEGAAPTGEPLLRVESASALVRLAPLLRKNVQVASIRLIEPQVHVARDAQGRLNLTGLGAAAGPAAAPGPAAGGGVALAIASFQIERGRVHVTDASVSPPLDMWLNAMDVAVRNIAPGRPMDLDLRGALGGERQNVRLTARLTPPAPGQPGSLERATLALDGIELERILPALPASEPQLRGRLSLDATGMVPTLDPGRLAQSVSASGRLRLEEGRIANLNLLREVFSRLSMLPGLVEMLQARLPQEYQAKLAAQDTVLSPIDLPVRIEAGSLQLQQLAIRTDTFGISGTGRAGLDGMIELETRLTIEPAFSEAITRSVSELGYLMNDAREIELPLTVQGRAPRIAVLPDLNYVASKVIVSKVQDLLGSFLDRALQEEAPPAQ